MAIQRIQFTPEQSELALKLTNLQRKFVIELIKPNTSQRQAVKLAGSKAKTGLTLDNSASVMLRNSKVKAFYNALLETKTINSIMERDEALSILSNNARVKMTDVADYSFVEVGRDDDDQAIMQTVWTMKDSKDIDPNLISCIKSVTMTKQGPKIELHDQQGAIKQLSTMQGWDSAAKHEHTGKDGGAIEITEITRKII